MAQDPQIPANASAGAPMDDDDMDCEDIFRTYSHYEMVLLKQRVRKERERHA